MQLLAMPLQTGVDFVHPIGELDAKVQTLNVVNMTAGVGINAEGGEFLEIIKKMIFQGKPWNEDMTKLIHLIIELGDIMWYVAQA